MPTEPRKINGFHIPLWMDMLINIDPVKGCHSKSDLIKNSSSSYCYTYKQISILLTAGILRWEGDRYQKNRRIYLTEKGVEMRELALFMLNHMR